MIPSLCIERSLYGIKTCINVMISQPIWQWNFCENWYNYSKIDIATQNSKNRQDTHHAELEQVC